MKIVRIFLILLFLLPTLGFGKDKIKKAVCTITDFEVSVVDHGGTYLHGTIGNKKVNWIVLCSGGGKDNKHLYCDSSATKRAHSMAVAAQLAGRNLEGVFNYIDSCDKVKPYLRVNELKIKN